MHAWTMYALSRQTNLARKYTFWYVMWDKPAGRKKVLPRVHQVSASWFPGSYPSQEMSEQIETEEVKKWRQYSTRSTKSEQEEEEEDSTWGSSRKTKLKKIKVTNAQNVVEKVFQYVENNSTCMTTYKWENENEWEDYGHFSCQERRACFYDWDQCVSAINKIEKIDLTITSV